MDILAGGPLTGAAMNPALYFGTVLAVGHLNAIAVYFVGPSASGAIAWATYTFGLKA
jgi:aquaporin Z